MSDRSISWTIWQHGSAHVPPPAVICVSFTQKPALISAYAQNARRDNTAGVVFSQGVHVGLGGRGLRGRPTRPSTRVRRERARLEWACLRPAESPGATEGRRARRQVAQESLRVGRVGCFTSDAPHFLMQQQELISISGTPAGRDTAGGGAGGSASQCGSSWDRQLSICSAVKASGRGDK